MKKTSLLTLLSIATASPVMVSAQNTYKPGVYLGLSFGDSYMKSDISDKMTIPGYYDRYKKRSSHRRRIMGDLFAGYRHFFNKNMVGVELTFGKDNNKLNHLTHHIPNEAANARTRLKNRYKHNYTIVLGRQLAERWLAFIKGGLSLAKFNGKHTVEAGGHCEGDTYKLKTHGYLVGAGAEYALNKNLSVIGGVSYERFKKRKLSYKNISPFTIESNTGSIRLSYITTKVGLAYRF